MGERYEKDNRGRYEKEILNYCPCLIIAQMSGYWLELTVKAGIVCFLVMSWECSKLSNFFFFFNFYIFFQ